jgi:Alr-MurF fusion protein
MMHPLDQLRTWCGGEWLGAASDIPVAELAIDSRKMDDVERTLFIAIRTARRDGHDYLRDAYEAGVRAFLISAPVDAAAFPGAGFVLVSDTLAALQQIAAKHRARFQIPVVGITGSNGKTIVKEWLQQLLSRRFDTVRSPRSYNSQLGVPLSAWLIAPHHRLALLEAGISQPGEMEKLERIIRPTIGVFTNIGAAHSEGFLNLRQKINEKLVLFRHAAELVYCRDHHEIHECVAHYLHSLKGDSAEAPMRIFSWSRRQDADLRILKVEEQGRESVITGLVDGEERSIRIPFQDSASIENACHCWCVMLLLGLDESLIADGMAQLQPVAMRLERQAGINDCTIINDTYNSDLTSLQIALDVLEQQKQHPRHTVILSDMQQAGMPDAELYAEVAAMLSRHRVDRFIGVGPALIRYRRYFEQVGRAETHFVEGTTALMQSLHRLDFHDEAILLKGARSFSFEKLNLLLGEELHQTVLSVDLSALQHNLAVFRNHIGTGVRMMAMVKAFSYGSGSHEIAQSLQEAGVNYLSVAYADEGVALRRAGISLPIMVMSPDSAAFDRMIAWKLEPEIFNLRSLEAFTRLAQALDVKDYPIHIKLDTGMHRLGFTADQIDGVVTHLAQASEVKVATVFSHLAASEDATMDDFTLQQAAAFESMSSRLGGGLGYRPLRHLTNTAGIARHPELHYDMVRLGLGLYGLDSSGTLQPQLRQIGRLRTTIAQIKEIPAGETVGYGRRGIASAAMRIATISIGYADGYPRALGNGRGHVLIHGQRAPLVGVVCMDMCMVDITRIPEAAEGDEALIFGPELPLTLVADWADTIPYEIMTGISQRVKRVYVAEA